MLQPNIRSHCVLFDAYGQYQTVHYLGLKELIISCLTFILTKLVHCFTLLGTKRVNYCMTFLLTKYQTTFVLTAWLSCARRLRGIICVNTNSANFCNKLAKPHILNVLMTQQISYLGDICSPMNLAGSKNYLTWPLQHPLRTFCLWVGSDCFLHDFSQAQFHYFLNLQMLNGFF